MSGAAAVEHGRLKIRLSTKAARLAIACVALITSTYLLTGCFYGPRSLEKTHNEYTVSVKKVTEEQLLRTLVYLRYNESPVGLDITSIAAQYEASVGLESEPIFINQFDGGFFQTLNQVLFTLNASFSNRPTFSLVPSDEGEDIRRFLSPITGENLIVLTQTSWPVSTILRLYVERINGVPNAVAASGPPRPIEADFERFMRVTEILEFLKEREMSTISIELEPVDIGSPVAADAITPNIMLDAVKNDMEYRKSEDGDTWQLVKLNPKIKLRLNPATRDAPEVNELIQLLNLDPDRDSYELMVTRRATLDPGKFPGPPKKDIEIVTRSTAQVLFYLSNGIDIPTEHIVQGLTFSPHNDMCWPSDRRQLTEGLFQIQQCKGRLRPPENAYVAIKYRGYWFYIDDRDWQTKQTFVLLLKIGRLDFTRQALGGPALTLQVGR